MMSLLVTSIPKFPSPISRKSSQLQKSLPCTSCTTIVYEVLFPQTYTLSMSLSLSPAIHMPSTPPQTCARCRKPKPAEAFKSLNSTKAPLLKTCLPCRMYFRKHVSLPYFLLYNRIDSANRVSSILPKLAYLVLPGQVSIPRKTRKNDSAMAPMIRPSDLAPPHLVRLIGERMILRISISFPNPKCNQAQSVTLIRLARRNQSKPIPLSTKLEIHLCLFFIFPRLTLTARALLTAVHLVSYTPYAYNKRKRNWKKNHHPLSSIDMTDIDAGNYFPQEEASDKIFNTQL